MRYFLLGDNLLLRKNLHGVDTSSVPLADLEDSSESPSSDQLQELKVGWLEMCFVLLVSME